MQNNLLKYRIGLTLISGIGGVNGKRLLAFCGSAKAVFNEKRSALLKIPGIGEQTVNSIISHNVLSRAEKEVEYIERNNIKPVFFTDEAYPHRLINCEDGPLLLYYKGNSNLNHQRILGVVGTRTATPYGIDFCEKLMEDLALVDVLIISGLAYGIDSCAHRSALKNKLQTIGVLGHGHDRIYPWQNKNLAKEMLNCGGLLTEFISGTRPDRENFPKRNRIVAGLCDAVIVVESKKKGGAIITAGIANSYNRDVFAVPGRISDEMSEGCNNLIKSNRAALIQSAKDLSYIMGWDEKSVQKEIQKKLFVELTPDQQLIMDILEKSDKVGIDKLAVLTSLQASKVSAALLALEFDGLVISLPGKLYSKR